MQRPRGRKELGEPKGLGGGQCAQDVVGWSAWDLQAGLGTWHSSDELAAAVRCSSSCSVEARGCCGCTAKERPDVLER